MSLTKYVVQLQHVANLVKVNTFLLLFNLKPNETSAESMYVLRHQPVNYSDPAAALRVGVAAPSDARSIEDTSAFAE